jgi:isopenicillin N synthase-like dioxygenase
MNKVPELSLLSYLEGSQQEKNRFVDELFSGLKEYGFIILTDHDIEKSAITNAYQSLRDFFGLTTEQKMQYSLDGLAGQRGYTGFGVEHAKDQPVPDLKEFWHVGREVPTGHRFKSLYPDNVWPKEIDNFKNNLDLLYRLLDRTSLHILRALGQALDLPADYFETSVSEGNSILRPIYYPPVEESMPKGAVRAAAHEDINLITVLMGATSSGLELLDRDGQWLPVETQAGQLVVDTGDMMERLTNGVLPATTHRVVNPETSGQERFSMPFFVHPNPDMDLECIPSCLGNKEPYPTINSHEFLMQRLEEIGLMK